MARIGIIVAMLPEASCLAGSVPRPGVSASIHPDILLHVCGTGPERATRAAEHLVTEGVRGLMSFGTAGALVPGLATGEVLVPECVETAAGTLSTHGAWRVQVMERLTAASLRIVPGNMTEAEAVVGTPAQKAALGAARNAAAVDMESAAVLRVAARHAMPALVLRVIMDPLEMELPAFLLQQSDVYGRTNLAGVVLDLLRSPARLPVILKLSRTFNAATASMRSVGQHLQHLHPGHDALTGPR